jgi:hypothetical protein
VRKSKKEKKNEKLPLQKKHKERGEREKGRK